MKKLICIGLLTISALSQAGEHCMTVTDELLAELESKTIYIQETRMKETITDIPNGLSGQMAINLGKPGCEYGVWFKKDEHSPISSFGIFYFTRKLNEGAVACPESNKDSSEAFAKSLVGHELCIEIK
ncbi:MAG: hypothetical protein HOE90_14355 [Bacteriovoracaceae bacterium]|nr:hypothetical protein [Bacteriovoracaceae bacterium]